MTIDDVKRYINSSRAGRETFMYMGHDAHLFTKEELIILFNMAFDEQRLETERIRRERDMFAKM